MAEEHYPFIANELVEVNWTIGGFGLEVGSSASQAESMVTLDNAVRRRRAGWKRVGHSGANSGGNLAYGAGR